MKLYTNTWCNTDMPNQVTWVWKTECPNGSREDRIGKYCAISADFRRIYTLDRDYVWFGDFGYYPEVSEELEETGWTQDMLCRQFVERCEEVFTGTYTDVWQEDIAKGMMAMSEMLGLGWVMVEISDDCTYEDGYRIYTAEFARKAHIEEDVLFCFSEESVKEVLAEVPGATCDYEWQSVIMQYPDGSYDEDMAYVVYLPE